MGVEFHRAMSTWDIAPSSPACRASSWRSRRCRIVDARYLAPDIPAKTPPRFAVAGGARVIAVNGLIHVGGAPSQYVVVGSGKTATDACI